MTRPPTVRTRSWLFTPATRPDCFAKAAAAGADVAILDLEDAIAPRDKGRARTTESAVTATERRAARPAAAGHHPPLLNNAQNDWIGR